MRISYKMTPSTLRNEITQTILSVYLSTGSIKLSFSPQVNSCCIPALPHYSVVCIRNTPLLSFISPRGLHYIDFSFSLLSFLTPTEDCNELEFILGSEPCDFLIICICALKIHVYDGLAVGNFFLQVHLWLWFTLNSILSLSSLSISFTSCPFWLLLCVFVFFFPEGADFVWDITKIFMKWVFIADRGVLA